ncbi:MULTISPECIES: hypothetical protein [unclassified Enterococcus]|uniref:hypothetical protein n=1 Tax=unclassified Enterococcus TaxID=2608891 RepID=UPI0013EBBAB4|nr:MULTISPECIES: hypothetical protein [unclassified Enterococcus]
MADVLDQAQLFLTELSTDEKSRLYNDLLAIKDVYLCNKDTSFYTFRKIWRAARRSTECRKRTFHYQTENNQELTIHQIHEQRLFKNHYRIQILFNQQEFDYHFIEQLLQQLYAQHFSYSSQISYA